MKFLPPLIKSLIRPWVKFSLLPLLLVVPTTNQAALGQEVPKSITPRFTPDPRVYSGKTSGDLSLQAIATSKADGQCQGLASQIPNQVLKVEKDFGFLSLKVWGEPNLSLLVKGPDGIYCRNGKNPELLGAWVAGEYEIWIGTSNGNITNYQITISENRQ